MVLAIFGDVTASDRTRLVSHKTRVMGDWTGMTNVNQLYANSVSAPLKLRILISYFCSNEFTVRKGEC